MNFNIKNEEIAKINESKSPIFPKYTSQLMNLANQNAHGTRPKVVGQLSEQFAEYKKTAGKTSSNDWGKFYTGQHPNAIDNATDKIMEQIENLKEAVNLIDREMVHDWVNDLVVTKTYNGLHIQEAVLAKIAAESGSSYSLSSPEEEALGIDGYVGDTAYSIKPDTYKTMSHLPEVIDVKMAYYKKNKNGLNVEIED
ncbi:MAG: MjaI family restriction endonuclease [Firmicutes bacterium]|nr:MjaI family restriction endonuclease [Bacillota bacterium]